MQHHCVALTSEEAGKGPRMANGQNNAILRTGCGVVFATTAVLSACGGGGAKGTVKDYLNQNDCADRVKYILDPAKNGPLMLDYQKAKNIKRCVTPHKGIEDENCGGKKDGEYCTVTAKGLDVQYEVKKVGDGYKIDFRATYGANPTPIDALKAQWNAKLNPKDTTLRVIAKLTDAYVGKYGDSKDTHLSVKLEDPADRGDFIGYVPRMSEPGKALASLLSDGKTHWIMVRVSYHPTTRSADEIEIVRLVQDNWRQRDDEDVVAGSQPHLPASLFAPSSRP